MSEVVKYQRFKALVDRCSTDRRVTAHLHAHERRSRPMTLKFRGVTSFDGSHLQVRDNRRLEA
jgi:hypothetical protein